jgi:hypothetical protein
LKSSLHSFPHDAGNGRPRERFVFALDSIKTCGRENAGDLSDFVEADSSETLIPASVKAANAFRPSITLHFNFSFGSSALGRHTASGKYFYSAPAGTFVAGCTHYGNKQTNFR